LAANLRFRVQPSIDFSHMRSLTAWVDPKIPYTELGQFENIWKDTKVIDDLVKNATDMSTGAIFKYSHNYDYFYEVNSVFAGKIDDMNYLMNYMDSMSECDISFSNIGTFVYNEKQLTSFGPFKIEETFYTDSLCNTRTCLLSSLFYHISYWNEKLMIALCSNKAAMGSGFTERLVQLFKDNLKKSIEKCDQN
jgi:hypothetical protein